jgi:hypothetical protein
MGPFFHIDPKRLYGYTSLDMFGFTGEEFECVGSQQGRGSTVSMVLCEETAELILDWKAKGIASGCVV